MKTLGDTTMIIETTCIFCGKVKEIEVNLVDFMDWQDGMLVQDAFPYLSAGDREMFISGMCDSCWESMFDGDDWEE